MSVPAPRLNEGVGHTSEPRKARQSFPAAVFSLLFRPGDMSSKPAPPPEATDMSKAPPSAQPETETTPPPQESTGSQTSHGSPHPDEKGLEQPDKQEQQPEEDPALTAFQYSDGRVKVQHPGLGDRMRTYYPHEIKRIGNKNDILKTNQEKAIEGEAQLRPNDDGKIVLTERAGYLSTGYSFPTWKKWVTLFFTGLIQVSMNYNTSCYSNAVPGVVQKFHVSSQAARVGQMIYLVAYSFGCELWAPWSEEYGRKPILQLSLTLVNCTCGFLLSLTIYSVHQQPF